MVFYGASSIPIRPIPTSPIYLMYSASQRCWTDNSLSCFMIYRTEKNDSCFYYFTVMDFMTLLWWSEPKPNIKHKEHRYIYGTSRVQKRQYDCLRDRDLANQPTWCIAWWSGTHTWPLKALCLIGLFISYETCRKHNYVQNDFLFMYGIFRKQYTLPVL